MGREEQQEEREVLDSIFPDEIQDVSETEFRISILLDAPEEHDPDAQAPTIQLKVRYPEDYPDEAPLLDINAPPNAPKHKRLDVQEDKARLLDALQATVEENMGMAMVFTLVSALKDAAELLIAERVRAAEAQRDFEAQKAEEEENRRFHGTAVTRETFLQWRERFRAEMEEEARRKQAEKEAEDKKKRVPKEEKKLTGKELWERGLAGKGEEEDDEGLESNMEKMKVAA
ncbi:RWD domain-containing protein [Lineolata rhizophorae]|uniref:RWD domain-containing protein n=1 Tax=Lineolata rhizophorae TaxID=578093 RepID=A0A6A6PB33_9PEZI|nr:RWD domain-containing protein [Lineolata rhizophorae]